MYAYITFSPLIRKYRSNFLLSTNQAVFMLHCGVNGNRTTWHVGFQSTALPSELPHQILLIVLEYPSRSNLNSFPEFYEASAERVMNSDSTQDCRHPLSGENHYQYLKSKNIFSFLRGCGSPTYQLPHPRHLFYKVTKHFPFPQAPF